MANFLMHSDKILVSDNGLNIAGEERGFEQIILMLSQVFLYNGNNKQQSSLYLLLLYYTLV